MAQTHPSLRRTRTDGGAMLEIAVLERLERELPEGFHVFHNVGLHAIHNGEDTFGEIDIVVLSPFGTILIVEVKSGAVECRDGTLVKHYRGERVDVAKQIARQYAQMRERLAAARLEAHVNSCLVMPDCVMTREVVSIPSQRVIDARDYDALGARVQSLLSTGSSRSSVDALRRFLGNEFDVEMDMRAIGSQLRAETFRLAEGLAKWVPRISSASGVFVIEATAGSGKTQLALRLLQDAVSAAQSALYVCFNRPLADHVRKFTPPMADVATFHELAIAHFRSTRGEPDFSRGAEVFAQATAQYLENPPASGRQRDLLIIDEAQDFEPEWVQTLVGTLAPGGRLYIMEDDSQRLYAERAPFELSDAVTVTCRDNYRSPRIICDLINHLRLVNPPVKGVSPTYGRLPDLDLYKDRSSLIDRTEQRIRKLIESGIPVSEIVVLTWHGSRHSVLLNEDKIGPWAIRKHTGKFDASENPIWTDGELLVESIYRFKGQSATAVILAELDFTQWTDRERSLLFVGLTRAHAQVDLILTQEASDCLDVINGATT